MSADDSLYRHGFARVAAAVPTIRIGDPRHNAQRTIALARQAAARDAALVIFPELGLSGYSADDLFHQQALLDAVRDGIATIVSASEQLAPVLVVGAPLVAEQRLFNCAVVIHGGRVLGVVPKSYLPNYREFYEKRQFAAARSALADTIELAGARVPFGPDLLFAATDLEHFAVHVEICEDLWTPIPPSTYAAMAGATVLANLSASNITVGKADYRRTLCIGQSSRTIAAYLYTAAGAGESTTDLAWDGQAIIAENGDLLAESERFGDQDRVITADVDLDRLACDRVRMTSFVDAVGDHRERVAALRRVAFALSLPDRPVPLRARRRALPVRPGRSRAPRRALRGGLPHPGAGPGHAPARDGHRAAGDRRLAAGWTRPTRWSSPSRRWTASGCRAPTFSPTRCPASPPQHTLDNAHRLMAALGVTAAEIDIRPSARQMLRDLGHPAADGDRALRRHLRERAGRRAHVAPVPPGQPPRRDWCSAPATSQSWRWAGPPTASATRCRTTTSTRPCPRR